ncbi:uncharacterized protein DS421_9g260170 [Arachis hypogaea]|nr:uncharacterized protein DS421_9g260170 [Arachis hypogaea]
MWCLCPSCPFASVSASASISATTFSALSKEGMSTNASTNASSALASIPWSESE